MKRYYHYQMDFSGKWEKTSGALMGVSVFALALYYFFLQNLADFGFGTILFRLILPLILTVGYIVLINLLKWNAPGLYGILGVLLCLMLLIGTFFTGGALRIIPAIFGYALAAAILVLCAGGYLPGRLPASMAFGILFTVRLLFFHPNSGLTSWVLEASALSMLLSLMCLPMAMVPGKNTKSRPPA